MRECPCKYCKKRTSECHSECSQYKEWCAENEALKERIKDKKQADRIHTDDIIQQRIRYKKRKGL